MGCVVEDSLLLSQALRHIGVQNVGGTEHQQIQLNAFSEKGSVPDGVAAEHTLITQTHSHEKTRDSP